VRVGAVKVMVMLTGSASCAVARGSGEGHKTELDPSVPWHILALPRFSLPTKGRA
jgi:hypothetical protein